MFSFSNAIWQNALHPPPNWWLKIETVTYLLKTLHLKQGLSEIARVCSVWWLLRLLNQGWRVHRGYITHVLSAGWEISWGCSSGPLCSFMWSLPMAKLGRDLTEWQVGSEEEHPERISHNVQTLIKALLTFCFLMSHQLKLVPRPSPKSVWEGTIQGQEFWDVRINRA